MNIEKIDTIEAQDRASVRGMSDAELMALPVTVNVTVAGRALGIGPNRAYELIKGNQFPVEVINLGSSVRVPTAPLKRLLGVGSVARCDCET